MMEAFKHGGPVTLPEINRFVDGASVKRVGSLTYDLCIKALDEMK